ncbi:MAG: BolA family transcriptional regulator [Myxococcales bacterium]|nr:BolA family transcriptional regulator [Myxococcales bacterium]
MSGAGDTDGLVDSGEERRARIEAKLRERLAATYVSVEDESHLHAGHAGAQSGAGHFAAEIESERFRGLTRLAAQRLVYEALEDEMPRAIHALRIKTRTPDAAD